MPGAKNLCSFRLGRRSYCVECGKIRFREDNDEWCMMLNYEQVNMRSLQDAVNEWSSTVSRVLNACECRHQAPMMPLTSGENVNWSVHENTFEILEAPDVLHVKVKARQAMSNTILVSETFKLNGLRYLFKSGMFYSGSRDGGHWRCIVNTGRSVYDWNWSLSPRGEKLV